jgi:cytochrome b561
MALHWIVGLGMIIVVAMGIYMTRTGQFALYGIHKSLGIILFAFILWRAILRLRKGWPEDVSTGAKWEHGLARVIHWVLIIGTIAMPLSGMLDAYMSGRGLNIFGLNLVAANLGETGRAVAISQNLAELGEMVHAQAANVVIAAIALHVVGALKHHIIDKDNTLRRMAGRT